MRKASVPQVLAPSLLRTATHTVFEHEGADYEGISVIVNTTVDDEAASVLVTIEGYDEAQAGWITLLTSAAIAAVGEVLLQVSPNVPNVANVSRQMVLPHRWRVVATHADGDDITQSFGAWLEPASS